MNREKQPTRGDNQTYLLVTNEKECSCSSDVPSQVWPTLWLRCGNLPDNVYRMERK